jgi:2-keto-3-deoxy-L-rhamnonate aldolase RhmA
LRGAGPGLATMRWPVPGRYVPWANRNVMVIVIIEQKQAVENIEAIAAVPGIDVLFIGLNDLSYSYGIGGKTNEPVMRDAVSRVLAAAARNKIPVGAPAGSPAGIKDLIARGFRFIQGPSELGFLRSAAREFFGNLQKEGVEHKDPIPLY